jgi:hypothetical protein
MTEDQLLTAVLHLCQLLGLRTAHFRPARTAQGWRTPLAGHGAGFPDLIVVGPAGVLARELKTDRGVPSTAQLCWLTALSAAGVDAGIWRPIHLHDGTITRTLQALRAREDGDR